MVVLVCLYACCSLTPETADTKERHVLTWKRTGKDYFYTLDGEEIGASREGINMLKSVKFNEGAELEVRIPDDPDDLHRFGKADPATGDTRLFPEQHRGLVKLWMERGVDLKYYHPSGEQIKIHRLTFEGYTRLEEFERARYILDGCDIGTGMDGLKALKDTDFPEGVVIQIVYHWVIGARGNVTNPVFSCFGHWKRSGVLFTEEDDSL